MTIIAKETFSNGIVSMFKGEIREIADGDPEYTALLEEGLVEEYSAGGGGGGNLEIVNVTSNSASRKDELEASYNDLTSYEQEGKFIVAKGGSGGQIVFSSKYEESGSYYAVFYNHIAKIMFISTDASTKMICNPDTDYTYYAMEQ